MKTVGLPRVNKAKNSPNTVTVLGEFSYEQKTSANLRLRSRYGVVFGAVALAELVHAAGRIEQYVLARIERVRLRANFNLDERIGLAFELDGVFGLNRGAGQKFIVARQVVEYHRAVFRVNALFHGLLFSFLSSSRFPTEKDCKGTAFIGDCQDFSAVLFRLDYQANKVAPFANNSVINPCHCLSFSVNFEAKMLFLALAANQLWLGHCSTKSLFLISKTTAAIGYC